MVARRMDRLAVLSQHVVAHSRSAAAAPTLRPVSTAATLTPSARRIVLRGILSGTKVVSPASVFDPLSAQMAQRTGYEAIQLAGSVAANVALGAPDLMLLSLSEFAALVRRITRYCSLPLVVDADHGYGNALGVARCVEELEAAGVGGITMEDTQLPAAHGSAGAFIKGSAGGFLLTSPEEQRAKLLAAVAAKTDASTVIIARTSSYTVGGIDELCRRVALYADTGADAVHVIGQLKKEEFPALRKAAGALPLMVSGPQNASTDELAAFGVRLALSGHTPFLAAMRAAYDAMKAAKTGGKAPEGIDQKDLADLLRVPQYMAIQKDFMKIEKPAEGMK